MRVAAHQPGVYQLDGTHAYLFGKQASKGGICMYMYI